VPDRRNGLKDCNIAGSNVVPEPFTGKKDYDNSENSDYEANYWINRSGGWDFYNNTISVSEGR
jgi:hypothetical protein